jgi:hypothetical protein
MFPNTILQLRQLRFNIKQMATKSHKAGVSSPWSESGDGENQSIPLIQKSLNR